MHAVSQRARSCIGHVPGRLNGVTMTILLLGKTGQVGWQLQRSLAPHGSVQALGRRDLDLGDGHRVRRLVRQIRPRIIVNAAAVTATGADLAAAEARWPVNAVLPGVLAEEALALDALLVHFSCAGVFAGHKGGPYDEDDRPDSDDAQGQSKAAGEAAIAAAGGKALIFRLGWVFGARGESFIKTVLRAARDGQPLDLSANEIGSPTPAALVATVTGVVLAQLRQGGGLAAHEQRTYHLAGKGALSRRAFGEAIVDQARRTPGFALRLGAPDLTVAQDAGSDRVGGASGVNFSLDCRRLERDTGLIMPEWEPYLERMLQLLSVKRNGY